MSRRRIARARSIATMATELGVVAPFVAAQRMAQLAAAGPVLTARERREVTRMIHEKQVAYAEAWAAAMQVGILAQQQLFAAYLGGSTKRGRARLARQAGDVALR